MDFCTLDQVKTWLKITTITDDDLLEMLISQTTEYIRSLMSRDFDVKQYADVRDGNGIDTLMLGNWPIQAVASVTITGWPIPASDFIFDKQTITLLNGWKFTRGRRNIVIRYTAGFGEIPPDVQRCCMELVGKKYRERDRIGVTSKTLAGEIVSFSKSDMTDEVKSVLRQYQRVAPI